MRILICNLAALGLAASSVTTISAHAASAQDHPCIQSIDKADARMAEIIDELNAETAYQNANGGRLSPTLERQFIKWYVSESSKPGNPLPSIQNVAPSANQLRLRTEAVDRFVREWEARLKAEGLAAADRADRVCAEVR